MKWQIWNVFPGDRTITLPVTGGSVLGHLFLLLDLKHEGNAFSLVTAITLILVLRYKCPRLLFATQHFWGRKGEKLIWCIVKSNSILKGLFFFEVHKCIKNNLEIVRTFTPSVSANYELSAPEVIATQVSRFVCCFTMRKFGLSTCRQSIYWYIFLYTTWRYAHSDLETVINFGSCVSAVQEWSFTFCFFGKKTKLL